MLRNGLFATLVVVLMSVLSATAVLSQGQLAIVSPKQADIIESGTEIQVVWESSDLAALQNKGATLALEISPDDGTNWFLMQTGIQTDVQEFAVMIDIASEPTMQYRLRLSEIDNGTGPVQSPGLSAPFEVFEGCIQTTFEKGLQQQIVCLGQPLSLDVKTTAKFVSYVWTVNGNAIAETDVPNLFIPEVGEEHIGDYRVIVKKKCGVETESKSVPITLAQKPVFTVHPPAKVEVCELQSTTLTASADGDGVRYQWYYNDEPLVGKTQQELLIDPVMKPHAGRYYVTATNMCDVVVASDATELTVRPFARVTQQPNDTTVCASSTVTLSVAAKGAPFTVQWYRNDVALVGATNTTLTIDNVSSATTGRYHAVITTDDDRSELCVRQQRTRDARISLFEAPAIVRDISNRTVCVGSNVELIAETNGAVTTYVWFKDGVWLAETPGNTLTINNISRADGGRYAVGVHGLCGMFTRGNDAVVTVVETPVITSQPRPVLKKVGQSFILGVVATGNPTFQWRKDSQPIAGATSSEYVVANATESMSGIYSVIVTNVCGSVISNNARVIVSSDVPRYGELTFATPQIDMGTVYRGIGHEENLVGLLKNTGNAPLSITSVTATSGLQIQAPITFPTVLQSQAEGDVVARLVPTELGDYRSDVSFVNSGIDNTAQVAFVGTVASAIDHPALVDLGTVNVHEERDSCFAITNVAPFPIAVQAVTGSGPSEISVSATLPVTLDPGSSFNICVRFKPTTAATQNIDVAVQSFEGLLARFFVRGKGDNVSPVADRNVSTSIYAYPNPTSGTVNIRSEQPVTRIVVRNMLGTVVQDMQGASLTQWNGTSANGSNVATGAYFLTVTTLGGSTTTVPVVLQ